MTDLVTFSITDDVAHLALDDGKANAISHAAIEALHAGLDRAVREAKAVVISGRPGRFSAGYDLSVMSGGPDAVRALVREGALLTMRIYGLERPVVVACTGHALAQGAIFLMAADVRIGTAGAFKIGLNEVAIGMPVPVYAAELARDRLSRRHLTAATALGTIYDPAGAVDAGYLDAVADPEEVVPAALERAASLAATLNLRAFAATRTTMRGTVVEKVRTTLNEDIGAFFVDA
jgi:enoyl-CoA hydratase